MRFTKSRRVGHARRRIGRALALALLGTAFTPALADASLVAVTGEGVLVYNAAPGETNRLLIEGIGDPPTSDRYQVSDPGASIAVGPGCSAAGGQIRCTADSIFVDVGDRHDVAEVRAFPVSEPRTIDMLGQAGNDRLFADSSHDVGTLSGGAGDDEILIVNDGKGVARGGTGNDVIHSVNISRGKEYHGDAGNDRLISAGDAGPENYFGGTGDDVIELLQGESTSFVDELDGGSGIDSVLVRGSFDLNGTSGIEKLTGSSLSEELIGDGAPNLISGGGGDDTVRGNGGTDILVGDAGGDLLDGGSGNDLLRSRDGEIDEDRCGAGSDLVDADARDVVAGDCEGRR